MCIRSVVPSLICLLKVGSVKYDGLLLALFQGVLVMLTCGFFMNWGLLASRQQFGKRTGLFCDVLDITDLCALNFSLIHFLL